MRLPAAPFRRPAVVTSALAIGLNALLLGQHADAQGETRTKRVAILDFDYSTVRSATAELFGTDIDVGRGVSDMLVTTLVNDGTYRVPDRGGESPTSARTAGNSRHGPTSRP